jgi:glycosyltransferase involved in cell wall biosynthesis
LSFVLDLDVTSPTVGFVTTCKGRLHHLKETLPLIVADHPDEVIVVDYDCPQGAGAWVASNYPNVRVVYVRDGSAFRLSRARNEGIKASTADILCIIDADILVKPGFVAWIKQRADRRVFFRQATDNGRRVTQSWGTFVCPRRLLLEVGLYDEAFDGWGGEDDDIYYRLKTNGSVESSFPLDFVRAISHGSDERFALYQQKDKHFHLLMNDLYSSAKRIALGLVWPAKELPYEVRQQIWEEIKRSVATLEKETVIRIRLSREGRIPPSFHVDKTVTIELKVGGTQSRPRASAVVNS